MQGKLRRESQGESPHLVAIDAPIPLARATPTALAAEVTSVVASPVVAAVLNAIGGGVLVLNAHRQIVAANLQGLVTGREAAAWSVLGLRPGEALGCVHASEQPGGCGAAEACRTCGALKTILGCQATQMPVEGECLVTVGNDELQPFELRLRASPLVLEGRPFTVFAIRDASDEKRRSILEQIFFHDVLNTLTGLSISSQLLLRAPAERCKDITERVARQVKKLEDEIKGQRMLLDAEHGTLQLSVSEVSTQSVLREVAAEFHGHPLTASRALVIAESDSQNVDIHTDAALLRRVFTNMVTNALEATGEGGLVRVWCSSGELDLPRACTLHVHNDTVMPRNVAIHVFQRSFSTKANRGRGLGTYSMKLLGEHYLGGSVSFVSTEDQGTTFSFGLPARASCAGPRKASLPPCF
ncbi:MAG TPA: HAMP domain-containing sensor histidine kinase [Anaeromyxobacteraceae bacterium]|nr:HAMP domain-containing sensor histidine kinase [Anaeromyxobacteraceae bacterium]